MNTSSDQQIGPSVGHLQTDTFCAHCGYNLVTQSVLRDSRLEILVVRCPECGRFSAAGQGTSASRVWLNRFATLMLGNWVMFLLAIFALTTFFLGMLSYGHAMAFTETMQDPVRIAVPGRLAPTTVQYVAHYIVRQPSREYPGIENEMRITAITLRVGAIASGMIAGGIVAVFLWHLRGWRRLLAFVLPVLGCGVSMIVFTVDPMTELIRRWGQARIAAACGLELIGVLLGLMFARPIVRGVLRLLLPPKVRQHFAFLWNVDGKRMKLE